MANITRKSVIQFTLLLSTLFTIFVSKDIFSSSDQIQIDVLKFNSNLSRIQEDSKTIHDENKTRTNKSRSMFVTNRPSFIRMANETKEVNYILLKNSTGNGSLVPESKEFPGMPDPCISPRRKTIAEDILCLVRNHSIILIPPHSILLTPPLIRFY